MKIFAILGGSGSGKTALSLEVAQKKQCAILSLDSLSVYQEIDLISAKPTKKERAGIPHFGIDILSPTQSHNVQIFIQEYQKAKEFCQNNQQNLLIVGGSSFYLKMLLEGLSDFALEEKQRSEILEKINTLGDLEKQYSFLESIDKQWAIRIKPTDYYRIQRALEIYFATSKIPSLYFKENPPIPIIENCEIYEIVWQRDFLRQRIKQRTRQMLENGAIDEVCGLLKKYGKTYQWAKSIGIKEIVEFLEGKFSQETLEELISTHTAQLAKRQRTFNKTQFKEHFCGEVREVLMQIQKNL
ncbi:tRNA (adenosine(37)-N6)-dimethylallyltransferase MiaA [Helicobacter canadensis]|uniref:tRNA dimethylallyltransferase n=1 Tax=Helicobacter canadensis MIT 98-5491 TaxID=537970 RepID=C5ZYP7_9HELI|nr:tRNA (adenosine(37)-N6)-dimethylallyltransferase MiaA [Helicobacter canadensis]EES89155.1 tRNA delta(2)-isopentenylpyrophosphate transferase [Helicobacter canadensis MIT 98-5491]EFR47936.1 tRNA dimethylallyltransferase [Helicobacter canadensis MIT 98-5491]STO99188.1 tRNA delta(2)-isopentenylpyrophosphate transferase [Helicobacter canadensis]